MKSLQSKTQIFAWEYIIYLRFKQQQQQKEAIYNNSSITSSSRVFLNKFKFVVVVEMCEKWESNWKKLFQKNDDDDEDDDLIIIKFDNNNNIWK